MSRLPKRTQQAKRVAPPAIPEIYRHSGSSFGSAGYGSCDDGAISNVTHYYPIGMNDANNLLASSLQNTATSNSSLDQTDNAANRSLHVDLNSGMRLTF